MPEQIRQFRKHLRMRGFDYRSNESYFVTIVTGDRECVFGSIDDGVINPTKRGVIVSQCWNKIPEHHPFVALDAFILMPNHLHGILLFVGNEEATQASQLQGPSVAATPASPLRAHGPASHSLGAVIGSFKSAVSREINRLRPGAAKTLWQPNYFEHIIRHDHALDSIRNYILSNPDRWDRDVENRQSDGTDDYRAYIQRVDVSAVRKDGDAGVAATNG